jgi:transposase InsO family protein
MCPKISKIIEIHRNVAEVCPKPEISERTYCRWRKEHGGMRVDQAGRLKDLGMTALFIEPGSPWENGYFESYTRKFRDEFLNGEVLDTLMEAVVLVEAWRQEYNRFRPPRSLGYKPLAPEVKWLENPSQGVVH